MVNTVTNWAGEPSFVSCIYKDHEMPKKHFIDDMKKVFEHFSNYPSIITGDFNLYDEHDKDIGLLNSLAKLNGFVPTVHQGTTINDHLLDQIFVNDHLKESFTSVNLPSYFSDHNLVVLCLKKNDFYV